MQNVFDNPLDLEKLVKVQYGISDIIMMENAARSMRDFILGLPQNQFPQHVLIMCGKGNNGGDGYALARLLQDSIPVSVFCLEEPTTAEAIAQSLICRQLDIPIYDDFPQNLEPTVIVDCLYGTGFHGDFTQYTKNILDKVNETKAVKIACDVPSGMYFQADYTITMGEYKYCLFSDAAKKVCGKIIVANLGISQKKFEIPDIDDQMDADTVSLLPLPIAYLLENSDMHLPVRTDPSTHKGSYGHTSVYAGEKAGAGIMAATASMHFGSGLTTIVKTDNSNLEQFKVSPSLMVTDTLPEKTNCVVLGPGLGTSDAETIDGVITSFLDWFTATSNPACVLDADIFDFIELKSLLEELNHVPHSRIVLTPHLKEYEKLIDKVPNIASLENITVIRKSANTFIYSGGDIFICNSGTQSLAKGGSGDILTGMIGALLSQGYSAKEAAITGVLAHAKAGRTKGIEDFSLTPEILLTNIVKTLSNE